MNNIILPFSKTPQPIHELTMLDNLPPDVCARIMTQAKTRDGIGKNYGHRAIVGAFLFKTPLVLFTDFIFAMEEHFKIQLTDTERLHIETCICSVHPELTIEQFRDQNLHFSFQINQFLMQNLNGHKTLAWMYEDDDEYMWKQIYVRMNRNRG